MYLKPLFKLLGPLKKRMFINITVRYLIYGFLAAGIISMALSCISLLTPILWLTSKILWIYVIFLSAALIISICLFPDNLKVLKKADSFGIKERLITAYELRKDDSKIALLQRDDAYNSIAHMDLKAHYPIRTGFEYILIGILIIFLIVGTFFIPSVTRDKIADMEVFKNELVKQAKNIDIEKFQMSKLKNIDKSDLKIINEKLSKFRKELLNSKSEDDAIKALAKVKNELLQLKQGVNNSEFGKISENFKNNPFTKSLADAMKSGNISDLKKGLEELKKSLNQLNTNEQKKLSEQFKQAAEQVKDNKQLKQSLSTISNALETDSNASNSKASDNGVSGNASSDVNYDTADQNIPDNNSASKEQISNLEDSLSQQPEDSKKSQDKYDKLLTSINQAKSKFSNMQDESGQLGEGQDQNNNQNGKMTDNILNSANDQKKDDGGFNPYSIMNGDNSNNGGAASLGSSSGDIGNGGAESGNSEIGKGSKRVKDYESVYVPKRLGSDSQAQATQVKGTKGESGKSTFSEAQDTTVEKGTIIPYDKVWGQYKNEAMNSMQGNSIPEGMKDIVRDYFSSLD